MTANEYIKNYEGILILCIVILISLAALFTSFVLAYVFKWERLMTEIQIQKEIISKKIDNETIIDMSECKRTHKHAY